MRKNVIVDLDGTLALENWRRPLIESHGWDEYFDRCGDDDINVPLAFTLSALRESGCKLFVLTSRSEHTRKTTEEWLCKHKLLDEIEVLCMRDSAHYHSSNKISGGSHSNVKLEMAEKLGLTPENTLMVMEDLDEMVNAWRMSGFDCWQVHHEGEMFHAK